MSSDATRFCEDLLDQQFASRVRGLLDDDETLYQESLHQLKAGQQKMRDIFLAVKLIHQFLQHFKLAKNTSMSSLSMLALNGELLNSPALDDLLATIKALDSDNLQGFIAALPSTMTSNPQFRDILDELNELIETYSGDGPLRSEYDNHHFVVKTTVVQQRVGLSKGKAKLPKQHIEYTQIVDRFQAALEAYLAEILVNPQDLFLHEVFLFDLRNPLKETFGPRPRFAIERALSSPFDYLMSSSEDTSARMSTKQPATAILYQLYLESGALVNVHDLWQAFYTVFESDHGSDCDERMVMALFYRALSELKAFGIIKNARRNVDHVAKSAWLGL